MIRYTYIQEHTIIGIGVADGYARVVCSKNILKMDYTTYAEKSEYLTVRTIYNLCPLRTQPIDIHYKIANIIVVEQMRLIKSVIAFIVYVIAVRISWWIVSSVPVWLMQKFKTKVKPQ
jgi:hypothetical protein